jgi:hypothetical protein
MHFRSLRQYPEVRFSEVSLGLNSTADESGFISERVSMPKRTANGVKGKARPDFSADEIKH